VSRRSIEETDFTSNMMFMGEDKRMMDAIQASVNELKFKLKFAVGFVVTCKILPHVISLFQPKTPALGL